MVKGIRYQVNVDSRNWIKKLDESEILTIGAINKTDNLMARRLAARVRGVIRALPYHGRNGGGHNTPKSLTESVGIKLSKTISRSNNKGTYDVYIRKIGSRGVDPVWIEKGTNSSDRSSRGPNDKGSVAKRPWAIGNRRFAAKDVPDLRKKLAMEILAVNKNLKGFGLSPIEYK